MILITIGLVALVIGTSWYLVYGLKPYQVSTQDISERYSYVQPDPIDWVLSQMDSCRYSFTYKSFDGENVNGQLHLPVDIKHIAKPIPVLIGMHAMGRSHERWFQDNIGGRKTVENTHKITELALKKGYAVVAIDARKHGKRKDPKQSVNNIISDMHRWGKREPYENMLVDTVKDLRVLIDCLQSRPEFDNTKIQIAGYSMGAHIGLLLAAVDPRVSKVAAIAPPFAGGKTAIVSPKNIMPNLAQCEFWLFSSNNDEYASKNENKLLFAALPGYDKRHFTFDSNHILPESYVDNLKMWL